MKRRMRSPAVTLVEVLVVVILLAVIAGVAYQSAWRAAEKTKIRVAWSMLRLIDVAAKSFNKDEGRWPDDITELVPNYIDDPDAGQTDWDYELAGGAPPNRGEARRTGGSCVNKFLRRPYRGTNDGTEQDLMPACP